jgi:hypothetical protein
MALPPGMTPEQYAAMFQDKRPVARAPSPKERDKARSKRKAEKAARKKSRRR